jgi:alpha-ribazole phosphatase
MKLWLVRHAKPLIEPGLCYGATDVAVDQADNARAALALAQNLPTNLLVCSSPLQRCQQLAGELQRLRPDLSYRVDARLAEMDFGCWECQPWSAIAQADYQRWTDDFWLYRFGGKESVCEFMRRVEHIWEEQRRQAGDAVWVTHAGVIRAASLLAQGVEAVSQASQWPRSTVAYGECLALVLPAA